MQKFISFSGGVESTTMCILYGKGAKAIWCNPGDKSEHKEMLSRIEYVEGILKDYHGGDFEIIKLTPSVKVKGEYVSDLRDYILKSKFFPSAQKRYCTGLFKIEPIDDFLKSQGNCELMIGFNADEEPNKDRTGNKMKCENVKYTYPLYEDGIDRKECEDILNGLGLHPNFPIYMSRGGCNFCFYKSIAEYKALYLFDRDTFNSLIELEEAIQDNRKKYYAMIISGVPFRSIGDIVEGEIYQWGKDEVINMYKKTAKTKTCGAFCHR